MKIVPLYLASALLLSAGLPAQNWPSFRGPGATGVVATRHLPTTWDVEKSTGISWKTAIPGLAHSSPIVWGDRIFVTTAVSSNPNAVLRIGQVGGAELSDDNSRQSFRIYCLDRARGKILWAKTVQEAEPRVKRHLKTTHASATPATNGKYLVALFASGGLFCFDLQGNLKWSQDLGVLDSGSPDDVKIQWGPASSPIIYKNLAIVQCDIQKDSFIAAFDLETGKKIWQTARKAISSWATPTVYLGKSGPELVVSGTKQIGGYDPSTGRELWTVSATSLISIPTPFMAHDLIYVASGYRRDMQPIYVIRPGSRGDLTLKSGQDKSDQILWSTQTGAPYIPTPIVYGGYLYVCAVNGVLACYHAQTGELIYQERVGRGGFFSSSPVAADGKIFLTSEEGEVHVVLPGPKYQLLATNMLAEPTLATPAISQGTLFFRTEHHLIAVGAK